MFWQKGMKLREPGFVPIPPELGLHLWLAPQSLPLESYIMDFFSHSFNYLNSCEGDREDMQYVKIQEVGEVGKIELVGLRRMSIH